MFEHTSTLFGEVVQFMSESNIWQIALCFVLLGSAFSMVRMIAGLVGVHTFDFGPVKAWLKNKFTDFMMWVFGLDFCYKLGLAREGVDFVECETQSCAECPFADRCGDRRKEYDGKGGAF